MSALAFLAGVLVGICAALGVGCLRTSGRWARWEEQMADRRPFDDRRPEERR